MSKTFPIAVPEIPVSDLSGSGVYYEKCLLFKWDWGVEGIGQISRGRCRIFLTDSAFRGSDAAVSPVVVWINLDNRAEVDQLYQEWKAAGARIVSPPESKPWNLHEFTAEDLDGNRLRVFYDFAWELPDKGGRTDDTSARKEALGRA